MRLDIVRNHLPDALPEKDGSIIFECPVCRAEGHYNKQARLYVNGAISCSRFASAGADANRRHCEPIHEQLGVGAQPSTFIVETLFDGALTLECEPAERGKTRIVARNCASVLNRDVIDLNRLDHRSQFIKALPDYDESQRSDVHQALLRVADRFDNVQSAIDGKSVQKAAEKVISKILLDGRVIEQIAGGTFAVYDPKRGEVTYSRKVETDDAVYRPLDDDFILKGGLFLPDRLTEYCDDATLDAEIETCINRYSDVPVRERRLSAKYARLSYITDKLNEISYLRAVGERGTGKSRYICTTGMLCLRPVLVTSPSAASLYRMIDTYQPTLVVDECNFAEGGDDTAALMQILNCGFQRLTFISRIDRGADGQMTLRMFSAFGPKLIGSLKLSDSAAFESRCVAVQLRKTVRKDIPFRMTARMLSDFAELRSKLYLWRLRNLSKDYEHAFDKAESELKNYRIEPRFIQIATSIYGMISDDELKADFVTMMEGRTDDAADEKKESFDGQLIVTLHRLLFDVEYEQGACGEDRVKSVEWKPFGDLPEPAEGKPLEQASIEQITNTVNEGLPEKKRYTDRWISRELGKLGFKRQLVKRRQSLHYQKSAVVFVGYTFENIFGNYSLPLPPDIISRISRGEPKSSNDNQMRRERSLSAESERDERLSHVKPLLQNDLREMREVREVNLLERTGEDFPDPHLLQSAVSPTIVALDAKTEPFDEKRGISPRNARMIGLALSYDGTEKTDYVTDPDAWPMLMPEPETIVVMHDAKFDFVVLKRKGLPVPENWEDTMIAAHLLDETGDQGLKSLAKEHLNIDDPLTFDEADRMRLLDPVVFEEYARNDARYTFRLWPKFRRGMERQGLLDVYELEKAVTPVVMAMEESGMKLDLAQMDEMRHAIHAEAAAIEAEIYDYAGCRFDLHSPQKVAAILFDKLGVPSVKETSGGQRSVDREALEDVRGYHPAVDAILRYREIDKLASTFLSVLPTFADEADRIHPEFRQLGATSGRFSCSNPNVQQIPSRSELGKKLRRMFVADEGNALVVADWSQMELRILAQFSKDPLLLSAYQSGTETDLHTLAATRMFGKAEFDVSQSERSIAKMINFGIAYGITPIGLFNRLRPQSVDVSIEQCEQFIADYFKAYFGVRKFLDHVESRLRERGYVRNWFGRRRRLSGRTAREVRQAQNFIIQSTAADMAKTAMVRLHSALPEGARLIAMVHDEFIVECRRELANDVRDLMVEAMQTTPEGFIVPMVVEAKIAGNWGDAK